MHPNQPPGTANSGTAYSKRQIVAMSGNIDESTSEHVSTFIRITGRSTVFELFGYTLMKVYRTALQYRIFQQ